LSLHASDRRSDDVVVILYRALDTRYAISAGASCFQRRPATVQAPCNVRCGSTCVKMRIFELELSGHSCGARARDMTKRAAAGKMPGVETSKGHLARTLTSATARFAHSNRPLPSVPVPECPECFETFGVHITSALSSCPVGNGSTYYEFPRGIGALPAATDRRSGPSPFNRAARQQASHLQRTGAPRDDSPDPRLGAPGEQGDGHRRHTSFPSEKQPLDMNANHSRYLLLSNAPRLAAPLGACEQCAATLPPYLRAAELARTVRLEVRAEKDAVPGEAALDHAAAHSD
jgi:hypothetical protein